RIRGRTPSSTYSDRIAPEKIRLLLSHIPEPRDIAVAGISSVCAFILEALKGRVGLAAIVVPGDVFTQQAIIVTQAIRKSRRGRIQQDGVGVQCGGIDENDGRVKLNHLLGVAVDDANAGSLSFLVVVDDGMHDGVWAYRQITCLQRPGKRGCIAAEIRAVYTTPVTHSLIHTLGPSLVGMNGLRIGDVSTAGLNEVSVLIMFCKAFLEVLFNATHLEAGHALAVWKFRQTVTVTRNAGELLNVRVPGFQVFIPYGPVDSKTVACRTLKIEITPPLRLSCPEQRFSSHVIPAKPPKGLFLDERLFIFLKSPV